LVTKFFCTIQLPNIVWKKKLLGKNFRNFFPRPPKVCSFERSSKTAQSDFFISKIKFRIPKIFSKRVGNFDFFGKKKLAVQFSPTSLPLNENLRADPRSWNLLICRFRGSDLLSQNNFGLSENIFEKKNFRTIVSKFFYFSNFGDFSEIFLRFFGDFLEIFF